MERLCERPGCSDPASVAYGMRPEDLVFWLDALRVSAPPDHGVLCRRHADTMVVPRGWTLDDLRDPDLHLFRPPAGTESNGAATRQRTRRAGVTSGHEQLALGVEPPEADVAMAASSSDRELADAESAPAAAADTPADEAPTTPWMPMFDTDDDLDGLLDARSPLLSRAFRGDRSS